MYTIVMTLNGTETRGKQFACFDTAQTECDKSRALAHKNNFALSFHVETDSIAQRIIDARCDGKHTIITRDAGGNLVDSVTLGFNDVTTKVLHVITASERLIAHGFTIEFE